MKNIKILIAIFFITTIATAQKAILPKEDYKNRFTISAAGASFENSEVSISWTLGDTLFTLSEDNSEEIPPEIIELNLSIRAYPNPTQDYLIISYDTENKEFLDIIVYDLNRKKLFQKSMVQNSTEISLQHLPNALYEIKILNSKNQLVKSFKIIKY